MRPILSELLRGVSGAVFFGVLAFAVLLPTFVYQIVISPTDLAASSGDTATLRVFAATATSAVLGMFVGAYTVTREHYYGSLDRTRVLLSSGRAFVAKGAAAVILSVLLAVAMAAGWLGATAWIVTDGGSEFVLSESVLLVGLGSIVAAALGAVLGHAVGWIALNYYVACAFVLVVPLAIELPLMLSRPEVERFLPSGALAGLAALDVPGLLLPAPAALVSVGWAAVLSIVAVIVRRRRTA